MDSDIPVLTTGKKDERLDYFLSVCKQAVTVFVDGLTKMEYAMRYKAIELSGIKDEEINGMTDLISTAIALEINKQAKETISEITYAFSTEPLGEGKYNIWLTARKEKPDYSNVPKMEEAPITDVRDVSGSVIVAPSGMGHLDAEHHVRC